MSLFAESILSETPEPENQLAKRIWKAIQKQNKEIIDDNDEDIPPFKLDISFVTFEILVKQQDEVSLWNNNNGVKLIVRRCGQDFVFRPQINIQWIGRESNAIRWITTQNIQSLYDVDGSKTISLFMALVDFGHLYDDLLRLEGEAIYASNVRGFLGRTLTNNRLESAYQQIANSGNKSDAFLHFPFKNNGITISCTEIVVDKDSKMGLVKPQIVNGQQTVRTWERKYKEIVNEHKVDTLRAIPVMLRIVQHPDEAFIREVAFTNNRQNPVSSEMLRSNEPVLVEIEDKWNAFVRSSPDLPIFIRKGNLNPDRINSRRLYELDYFLEHGTRSSNKTIENFFDDGHEFNKYFKRISNSLTCENRVKEMASFASLWIWLLRNSRDTKVERKRVINRGLSENGSSVARHPFFAVGYPGWNLSIAIFLQSIINLSIKTFGRNYYDIATDVRKEMCGTSEAILENLKKFSKQMEEEYGDNADRYPDVGKEWLYTGDRFSEFLMLGRCNYSKKSIIDILALDV
jgi:hypothetical protein